MPAGGAHIGTVYVKVEPDVKGFKRKTREDLEREAKDALPVEIEPDSRKARKEIGDLKKDAKKIPVELEIDKDRWKKRLQNDIESTARNIEQQIPLTGDFEKFRRDIDKQIESLKKRVVNIDVTMDPRTVAKHRQYIEKDLAGLQRQAQIRISPDSRNFRAQVERITQRLKAKLDVDFDDQAAAAKLRARVHELEASLKPKLGVQLEISPGQKAKILAEVAALNTAIGAITKEGGGLFSGFFDKLAGLGPSQGGGGKFGFLYSFLDTFALIAAVAAIVAPALALISGLITSLPGLFAAAAIPIGAVALGLDGIKEAAKVLEAPFTQIKETMSGAFRDALTPAFERLGAIMPRLALNMPRIAEGFGRMADALVDVISSEPFIANLDRMFGNIGEAIGRSGPGLGAFAQALSNMATGFSDRLPGMADKLNEFGNQFLNWTHEIMQPDELGTAPFDRVLDTMGSVTRELGGLIKDLFTEGFDLAADPEFGKSMTDFVANIRTIVQDLMPSLKGLWEGVAGFVNDIAEEMDNWVSNPIFAKIAGIDDATRNAAASRVQARNAEITAERQQEVTEQIEAQNRAVDAAVKPDFEPGKTTGILWWEKWESEGADAAGKVARIQYLEQAIAAEKSRSIWQQVKDATFDFFTGDWTPGGDLSKYQSELDALRADLEANPLEIQLQSSETPTGGTFADQLLGDLTGIGEQIQQNVNAPVEETGVITTDVLGRISQQANNAGPAIQQSFAGAKETLSTELAGMQQQAATAVQGIAQAFTGLSGHLQGAFAGINGIAVNAFSQLGGHAQRGMQTVVAAIQNGANQAVQVVQSMATQIVAALESAAAGAQAQGAAIGSGMAAGISSTAGAAVAAARDMVNQINAEMSKVIKPGSPSKLTTYYGQTIGQGLALGINQTASLSLDAVKDLLQAVKDVFGSADGLTINFNVAGAQQAQTAFEGIANSSQTIGDSLSNVPLLSEDAQGATFTAENQQLLDQLKTEKQRLDLEIKRLKLKKDEQGLNSEEEARYDSLRLQRDKIALQRDELAYQKEIAGEVGNTTDQYQNLYERALSLPFELGQAPLDALTGDLNIGGGAITAAAQQGLDWIQGALPQFVFNVSNVDEAIAVKNNQLNKQALQYQGR